MRTHWIVPILLLAWTVQSGRAQVPPADGRPAGAEFQSARQLIQQWMARDSVPGLAIAVARGDAILWEQGFGWADREARMPAKVNTPFYLASVTKTITATALMLLHQRGRLDIDQSVNRWLAGPGVWSPAYDPAGATLRRLAMHTAGLTTFDMGGCAPQRQCTIPGAAEIIRRYGVLVSPPGDRYDYSNLGYLVLGEAIARAAGRDFGAVLREEIFQPLGMRHSSFGLDPALRAGAAVGYHPVRGPIREPEGPPSGGSTAWASAHDLALFGQMHVKAGRRDVLTPATIDSMQLSTVPAGAGARQGIGWSIEEDRYGYRALLAQGGVPSGTAWLRLIPAEGIVVVVLANKGVGFPAEVIDEVLATLLPRYRERRAAQPAAPAAAPAAITTLDSAFTGRWSGSVKADSASVPVALTIDGSGSLRGTIGTRRSGDTTGTARVCCGGVMLRVSIPGDLFTPDSIGGPLVFYMRLREGTLRGHVTTRPDPALGLEGRVSYWVELRKQR